MAFQTAGEATEDVTAFEFEDLIHEEGHLDGTE